MIFNKKAKYPCIDQDGYRGAVVWRRNVAYNEKTEKETR